MPRPFSVPIPFSVPPPDAAPFDVVTLGLNSVDLITVVAEYPPPNSKQRARQIVRLAGGQMATAAAVCARLGWRARYIGAFGDDDAGAFGRASLVAEGVDLEASWTVRAATNQFAVVIVDASSGDRTVLWHRDPKLTMAADAVPLAAVRSGRLLIVDCHETAASTVAARAARAAGIPTIIDVERVRPGIADLLQQIDAIVAAQAFPSELTGHGDVGQALWAMAREYPTSLVCVTLGEEGSLAICGGREIRTPGFRVACNDTTGAGDAFRGGLAAALLRDPQGGVDDALRYANAVAALNCRGLGARGGMPTASEVDSLLMARLERQC